MPVEDAATAEHAEQIVNVVGEKVALGLHNMLLTAFSFNERGIRAYRRAGFKEVGRRREARRLAGHAYDVVYMDCLASELESPVLRQLVAPAPVE